MPNHIHLLLVIGTIDPKHKGRDLISAGPHNMISTYHNDKISIDLMKRTPQDGVPTQSTYRKTIGPPYGSLGYVINMLKGGCTREINKRIHAGTIVSEHGIFARQPHYHDHIVRNEKSYMHIKYYIQCNPSNREEDIHYTPT